MKPQENVNPVYWERFIQIKLCPSCLGAGCDRCFGEGEILYDTNTEKWRDEIGFAENDTN